MNKKLLLFVILGMVISLVVLALLPAKFKTSPSTQEQTTVRKPVVTSAPQNTRVYTSLVASVDKNSLSVGDNFIITISINTGDNLVTGVQLELGYDPTLLAITTVNRGDFFTSPLEIANKNDREKGQIIYAVGSLNERKGAGTIATISATALKTTNGKIEALVIKPTTIVTEINNKTSVLKESKGAELVIR